MYGARIALQGTSVVDWQETGLENCRKQFPQCRQESTDHGLREPKTGQGTRICGRHQLRSRYFSVNGPVVHLSCETFRPRRSPSVIEELVAEEPARRLRARVDVKRSTTKR